MGRVEVDFGVGQGAKRRDDIRSDLGQASNAGQGQNPPQAWTARGRRAAGGVARSLQPAAGDAPPSLLAIRPSASTRDPSQYFNSLLVRPAIRGRPIAITDAEIFVPVRYWALGVFSGHRICLRSANPGQRLLLTQSRNPHSANFLPATSSPPRLIHIFPSAHPPGLKSMSSVPTNSIVEDVQVALAPAEPGGISYQTTAAAWQRRLLLS